MKSVVAVTGEIDTIEKAVAELCAGIREKLQFTEPAIGIACCDADVAVGELGRRLHECLGIDIIGLTTMATMERHTGYSNMGIVLTVLTGDDVTFSIGSTGEIDPGSYLPRIRETYADARARLPEDPKLILLLAPYIAELTPDRYMEEIHTLSDGVPIFGGVSTDHYDLQYQKTFYNGESYNGGLVFLMISGNVRPVFAIRHSFGTKLERKVMVTKSTHNQVERMGDQSFMDYLSTIMPSPETDGVVVFHFQSTPFIMELPDYEPSEQPVVRALCSLDPQTGAGGFLSEMPEGAMLSLVMLQRENLIESCSGGLDQLLEEMAKFSDGYAYSTVLVSSCNARHLLLADSKAQEAEIFASKLAALGPEVNAMGFYGFGEICPTGKNAAGKARNRFHNVSFTMCAF